MPLHSKPTDLIYLMHFIYIMYDGEAYTFFVVNLISMEIISPFNKMKTNKRRLVVSHEEHPNPSLGGPGLYNIWQQESAIACI